MLLSQTILASLLLIASTPFTVGLPTPPPPPPFACNGTFNIPTATLPTTGTGTDLPSPNPSLTLKAIGHGRGTQNYTCASPSAAPVAIGALATLFFDIESFSPSILGHHFFSASGVPTFDLTRLSLYFSGKKTASVPAPPNAAKGQDGSAAVPWLQLQDNGAGLSHGISEAYRVETAGGSAPASCASMPAAFQVQYSAQYWFYG
jgi:hypothetical protein